MTIAAFRKAVWKHYRKHGRTMAWRETRDPYRILVSEAMLQQTQVSRVAKFYPLFLERFPNFKKLAAAKISDVLAAWQGLGYNRRALALQRAAREVVARFGGKLPRNRELLKSLPGIGQGTSGSLMAFAFNEPAVFVETNIRRAVIHHFFPDRSKVRDDEIEPIVARALDASRPREWYWALMDYGSMLGDLSRGRKKGNANPNVRSKHYVRQSKFAGSDRELRGKLLRLFLSDRAIAPRTLPRRLAEPAGRVDRITRELVQEGFLIKKKRHLEMP